MARKILKALVERKFIITVIESIDKVISYIAVYIMSYFIPIEPKKILLVTSRGSFNCNPKAIANEIIKQQLPWELIWVAREEDMKKTSEFPEQIKLVRRDSFEFYVAAASSKIWIDNSINLSYMRAIKKRGQVLFETWHGSIGLKRFETNTDKKWVKMARRCGKRTDYCISNSDFEDELFRNTFWKNSTILKYGHARNDILMSENKKMQSSFADDVKRKLGLCENVNYALYAPTFRDDRRIDHYSIDYPELCAALEKRFGGKWCILLRMHFEVMRKMKNKSVDIPDCVVDVSEYEDIQDIMLVSSVGITDYSSWICDYVLTGKPGFIFATDLSSYYEERGFYYPLNSTPFPIAESNEQLIEQIINFDSSKYEKDAEAFIRRHGCVDDGHASERIVDKIKEIIGE